MASFKGLGFYLSCVASLSLWQQADLGDGINAAFDLKTVNRINEIQNLDPTTKDHVFATIDAFIKAAKLKSIAAL